jgi:hypothetical protein
MTTPFDDLCIAYNNGNIEEAETILYRLEPLDVALMKANGPNEITEMLSRPEFQPFWTNQVRLLRLERDPGFRFKEPGTQSKADFYCGWILYLSAQKASSAEKGEFYLKVAREKFNSFYAHRETLTMRIAECNEYISRDGVADPKASNRDTTIFDALKKEKFEPLIDYIESNRPYIERFKTPGCLILATTYYYLASFFQRLGFKEEAVLCYHACWHFLCKAEFYEKDSVREIHNAYFGEGLKLSNTLGYSKISELKDGCIEQAGPALTAANRAAIEEEVRVSIVPVGFPEARGIFIASSGSAARDEEAQNEDNEKSIFKTIR